MCEAVSPTFWATSTNLGGGPAPGRECAFAACGGGAAVGPMAAGFWGPPLCAFCGAGFCADTSAARTEIKRKVHAASLAGLRGMNAAILAQTPVVGRARFHGESKSFCAVPPGLELLF